MTAPGVVVLRLPLDAHSVEGVDLGDAVVLASLRSDGGALVVPGICMSYDVGSEGAGAGVRYVFRNCGGRHVVDEFDVVEARRLAAVAGSDPWVFVVSEG